MILTFKGTNLLNFSVFQSFNTEKKHSGVKKETSEVYDSVLSKSQNSLQKSKEINKIFFIFHDR